jgi:glycosyltransferase involved in cell wall biosynthesis
MEAELRALATGLGVSRQVGFLGQVSDRTLVDCYRRATLVVIPTIRLEGFGLAVGEALACGTPVVGTPVGAIPELLEPIDRRLIARDSTPAGLAGAVNALLEDPAELESIAAHCRARIEPALGWDVVAGRYRQAYQDMIESTAAARR